MSPFISFKDQDKAGILQLYILQRDFPHYCGYLSYAPIADAICCIPIAQHNIWINFDGTIRGRYIPNYKNTILEIETIMQDMGEWFYRERIMVDPKRYKKWLIST